MLFGGRSGYTWLEFLQPMPYRSTLAGSLFVAFPIGVYDAIYRNHLYL